MSEQPTDVDEIRKAVRNAAQELDQRTDEVRRRVFRQEINRAMSEELAQRQAKIEREAREIGEEITKDLRPEEARNARRRAPGNLLLLLLIFLVLYLVAAATGRPDIITFPGTRVAPTALPAVLSDGASSQRKLGPSINSLAAPNAGSVPPINSLNGPTPEVGAIFRDYYNQRGGERIFGTPISEQLQVNGRTVQWFERARLEEWPEYRGTPYEIQSGLLGMEFTEGVTFPKQVFFASAPNLRYFGETNHGVAPPFIQFWEQNGGLDLFGYPISDQIQEVLPIDGQRHTVQYFERVRIEHHPQLAGTPFEIQIGLLGRSLYLNENTPDIVSSPQPTPVPVPMS